MPEEDETPEAGESQSGPAMTPGQFRWEAMRERSVYFEAESERRGTALAALESEKREQWEPELARLTGTLAETQAVLSAAEQSLAAREATIADHERHLAELIRIKETWWEPELARLAGAVAEAQTALGSAERSARAQAEVIAERDATLAELLKVKAEWWEPEIARLTAEGEAASVRISEMTELQAATAAALERAQSDVRRHFTAIQYARRGLADAERRRRTEVEAHEASRLRGAELEHLIESWFKPEIDRLAGVSDERERRLQTALIEAAVEAARANSAAEAVLAEQAAAAEAVNTARAAEAQAFQAAAEVQATLAGLQGSRGYRAVSALSRVRRVVDVRGRAPG